MSDENPDYEKMYNELKSSYDNLVIEKDAISKKCDEANENIKNLKFYIADKIIGKKVEKDIPKDFETLYKETLKGMNTNKK